MKKVYFDTGVFIAFFDKYHQNHSKIIKFIEKNKSRSDLEFYSSSWGLTEALKVLLVDKKWKLEKVLKLSQDLLRRQKISDLKFDWLPAKEMKKYDLDEFFLDVQDRLFDKRIGVGDTLHVVLASRFKMDIILTFNPKDFKKFKDYRVIEPQNLSRYKF